MWSSAIQLFVRKPSNALIILILRFKILTVLLLNERYANDVAVRWLYWT